MFTQRGAALPGNKRTPGRRLAAVDIENIAGGSIRTPEQARWVRRMLEGVFDIETTPVTVGVSEAGLVNAYAGWGSHSTPRYVAGTGVNGADHALLDVLNTEGIAQHFDEVVLVSGDGIFAEAVARLGAQGVRVTVVAHLGPLATRLQLAAAKVVLLGGGVQLGGAA